MSIPRDPNSYGAPVHPGAILREDWLPDLGVTPYRLAKATGVSLTHIHEILKERRGITAPIARRLAAYLGTTPEYLLRLQMGYELSVSDTPELRSAVAQIEMHPQAREAWEKGETERAVARTAVDTATATA
jgi:addiction module HigA family antidote